MRNRSFTLIELILVVATILAIAGVAIIRFGPMAEKARSAEAYSALAQIVTAENIYKLENDSYTDIGNLDIDLPVSQNFTFSVLVTTDAGYAKAEKKEMPPEIIICV
ncbi:MAG: type II secretion system protein [Candidatus Omnitrophica bacterium]|nr:type II secretion system protein [Candidatus Omnitrophota bacterium]